MQRLLIVLSLVLIPSLTLAQTPAGTRVTSLPGSSGLRTTLVRTPSANPGGIAQGTGANDDIENGDFSSGLDGWTVVESGGSTAPGSVTPVDDQAQFLEGDSFLVSLQQTIVVPDFATTVTFDLILDPGFDTSSVFLPDAFEFSLLDENMLPVVEPWILGATSCFNMQEDGTVSTGPAVSWDGLTVTVDMTGVVPGDPVTLFLDFVNADVDTLGGVRIDDAALSVDTPIGSFSRGDADANGVVDATDAQSVFDLLFASGPLPVDCAGFELEEVADGNDNEAFTVADFLAVRDAAEQAGVLPEPTDCGLDPSEDLGGFDELDPAYLVSAGNVSVDPPSGVVDRDVFIPVLLNVPEDVSGLTLILTYDETLLTPFDPAMGEGDPFVSGLGSTVVLSAPGLLVFSLWTTSSGETLLPGNPGTLQSAGAVQFHLADFAVFPGASWVAEVDLDGRTRRATVVDTVFADHHPDLQVGEGEFARGDSNGDLLLNIVDPIVSLEYLFNGGPLPSCLDAVDANNDSELNIVDPIYALNFLFNGGPPLPFPYPGCGFDEGPIDTIDCIDSPCQP